MVPLSTLIEAQELEVSCGHCQWADKRPLSWLCERCDMHCPRCDGVIVLNTSDRRRAITALRRQASSLHALLVESLTAANAAMSRSPAQARVATPRDELLLVQRYQDDRRPAMNEVSHRRGNRTSR